VSLGVPLGARGVMAGTGHTRPETSVERTGSAPTLTWGPHDGHLTQGLHLSEGDTATVDVYWNGGLAVEPPTVNLVPGQESTGLRVVDFTAEGGGWLLELEGQAGHTYALDLYGERPSVAVASGVTAELAAPLSDPAPSRTSGDAGPRHRLHLDFLGETGRVEAQVHLRPAAGG